MKQIPGIYPIVTGEMDNRTTLVLKMNAQMIAMKAVSDSMDPMI